MTSEINLIPSFLHVQIQNSNIVSSALGDKINNKLYSKENNHFF